MAVSAIVVAALLSLGATQGKPAKAAAPAAPPIHGSADAAVASGMGEVATPSLLVLQALQQIHLTQCAAKVQQVTNFLFEGQNAQFIVQPLGPDGDRWPVVFMIESADPAGGHTRLSTLMISPGCAGMYQQMIYWPQACSVVKATVFAKFTGEHALLREVKVSDAGPALQAYLTPAGAGCISVKKELFR